jgi:hypothetical protein
VAETLAHLGDPDDTVAVNVGSTPVVDGRGRYYLLEKGGASVLVFDNSGTYMMAFGRSGMGPGEFRNLSELYIVPGDSLVVSGGGQMHVVDPNYRHVRQAALGFGVYEGGLGTVLADGRILRVAGDRRFAISDRDGKTELPVRLTGVDTVPCNDCGERLFREGIERGTIWSGQHNRYRLEQHDLSGRLLQGFVRKINWFPDWLPPGLERDMDIMQELTRPRFIGVRQSSDGLLWSHVLMVDDPEKLPNLNNMLADNQTDMPTATANKLAADMLSNFVTIVEAIDPVTREVLATAEFKRTLLPMLNDMVAVLGLDEFGDWSWTVLRLKLEGREGG